MSNAHQSVPVLLHALEAVDERLKLFPDDIDLIEWREILVAKIEKVESDPVEQKT